MKKILCIAECCCDLIFGGLPRLPENGQEIYGDDFVIRPGGGANTPIHLARNGADVTFLTALGADEMGQTIRRELESSGLRLRGRIQAPGTRTAVSAVLSTPEDRSFASYGGTGGAFFTPELLEEEIRRADVVHTFLGYCKAYSIAALCKRYRKELSLDTSFGDAVPSPETTDVLRQCDWLKVNQEEAARLTGDKQPEDALRKLAELVKKGVVTTLGSRGSIGTAGREKPEEKAIIRKKPKVFGKFRDACGAGDAYAAGMLLAAARGEALDRAMEFGTVLSGKCVTWLGGSSPNYEDESL